MAPLKDAILFIEVRIAVFSMPEGHHAHSSDASAPPSLNIGALYYYLVYKDTKSSASEQHFFISLT